MDRIIFPPDKENVVFTVSTRLTILRITLDRFIHQSICFACTRRRNRHGVWNGTDSGKIGSCLMTCSIRGILKTNMRKNRNHRRLRQSSHGQWQVAFSDTKLTKGIYNGNITCLRVSRSHTDHICFSDSHFDESIRKIRLKSSNPSRALNITRYRINGMPVFGGPNCSFSQSALDLSFLDRWGPTRCSGFGRGIRFPFGSQFFGPDQQFTGCFTAIDFIHKIKNLFATLQRKTVTATGALSRCLDTIALDSFNPHEHRFGGIGSSGFNSRINRLVNRLQVMPLLDINYIPSKGLHGIKRGSHVKGVSRDASRQFGLVIREHHDKRVYPAFGGQTRDRRKGLLGFTFHGGTI